MRKAGYILSGKFTTEYRVITVISEVDLWSAKALHGKEVVGLC